MAELGPSPLVSGRELPVDAARDAIARALQPLPPTPDNVLVLPLAQALGRVLAASITSPIDVPAHDNSAMDGYAFHGADLQAGGPTSLAPLDATVYAGAPFDGEVREICFAVGDQVEEGSELLLLEPAE